MIDTTALLGQLEKLIGGAGIVPPSDFERYERGYRYGAGRAAAVVRPIDQAEVRALVRFCHEAGQAIVIQGAHTGLVGAATPDEGARQIILSLDRLQTIRIDAHNRSATCGAGALLSALNAAAGEHGLHLPIDLGADPSLGGMVATNTGGARLVRYGGMREQILGIEAVLLTADATVVGDLDGLRKNNVGLDLKHLLVGSGGRVGIVTAVQVGLQPIVRQSSTALVVPCDPSRLPEIVSRLEAALDQFLTACEGLSRNAMKAALDSHPALRRPFAILPDYAILIEAGTSILPSAGIDVAQLLEQVLVECLDGDDPPLIDAVFDRGGSFWALRHAISDGLKALGRVIGFDISVRRDCVPATRAALLGALAETFPQLLACDFGHVADGGMHFNVVVPPAAGLAAEDEHRLRQRIFDIVVQDFGGSFSAEHGIGPANRVQYESYRTGAEREIIAQIERIGDPAGLLQ